MTAASVSERVRWHRARRREGLLVIRLEVRNSEVEVLVRRGLLDPAGRSDRLEIARAVGKVLDQVMSPRPGEIFPK